MYMQCTTSGAAGDGLYTTIKYVRGAPSFLDVFIYIRLAYKFSNVTSESEVALIKLSA
jgi:hypothetical protein